MNKHPTETERREELAALVMIHAVYGGREGRVLTSADRDDHQYIDCLNAAAAILAAGYIPKSEADEIARVAAEKAWDAALYWVEAHLTKVEIRAGMADNPHRKAPNDH